MQNAIYLRHRRRLVLPPGEGAAPPAYLTTLLSNIERLGFTFSLALIERARGLSAQQLGQLYQELVPALQAMLGADVAYRPMYPNFPDQVMEAPQAELYLGAILHYLTHALPPGQAGARAPLLEQTELRTIDLGDEQDFGRICTRLLAARSSLSAADRADLVWFFQTYADRALELLPEQIPLKETLALLATCLLRHTARGAQGLGRYLTTATDVLRLAVALSDGDVSLAASTRFRRFSRPERRMLLELLEGCGALTEDMLRRPEVWKRLGERLHPGEHRARYPRAWAAFDVLRNGRPFETFGARVERALGAGDLDGAAALLATRPGELARRLDTLLRRAEAPGALLERFGAVAGRVATPVLLQALAHFAHRASPPALRTFFPKGDVGKAQAIPNRLPALDPAVCAGAVALCREALAARFRARPPLGPVWVDPRLRAYPVPLAQRSASKALRTLARGSRMPLPPGGTVRFFLWWREGEVGGRPTGRVDIDLSAVLYDAAWRYKEHISYTNLRSRRYRAAHSGDIVTAPDGACEFIDLDIDSVLRYGGRYVVMALHSFSRQAFCDLPECYAGWMMRQAPQSGEIFEPRTVQDRIDVAADTRICLPVILDLAERTLIWADLALRRNPRWQNNVEGSQQGLLLMGQAVTTLVRPDLYELFMLHAAARGVPVAREQARMVFGPDGDVTPFDIGLILAEYL